MSRNRRGQSTVEYVILVTAVIVVTLAFLAPNGTFRSALGNTFQLATNGMEDMANRLRGSRCVFNTTSNKCE